MAGEAHMIYRPGTKVKLGNHQIAHIIQANISMMEVVTYLVSYWDGNTLKQEWVHPFHIEEAVYNNSTSLKIGFHNAKDQT